MLLFLFIIKVRLGVFLEKSFFWRSKERNERRGRRGGVWGKSRM